MTESAKRIGIGLVAGAAALIVGWRVCSKAEPRGDSPAASSATVASKEVAPANGGTSAIGLSAPIAAAHVAGGAVVVAGLDVPSKAIRVQRIDANERVVVDHVALGDVAWSADSDLKVHAHATEGAFVTWRGLRGGKLVRQLAVVGPDLAPKGEPMEIAAASCATREAVWFSDGARAVARPWRGTTTTVDLPKDKDASLLCGSSRAFALLEEEEKTSLLPLGGGGSPITLLRENDFGDDEQRELAEYTVGGDVGIVRVGGSGAVAVREMHGAEAGPLHKLKTRIPKDDDVIAVDASAKVLAIVYTEDASSTCPPAAGRGDTVVATKVMALRVQRESFEESIVELSPGRCGHEVGPFFSGVLGEAVSVAWTERAGGAGKARAPIVGLAHTTLAPTGTPALRRIEQAADALVDAGCDGTRCYAVALARREGMDVMVPGFAKVLRYE